MMGIRKTVTLGGKGSVFGGALIVACLLAACWPQAGADPAGQQTPSATARPAPLETSSAATSAPSSQATPTVGLPWATPGGPTPTPMPVALSNEITEAYLRFWKVRSEAAYELNPDILLQVSAGAQLDRERGLIAQLQAEGDVGLTLVDHSFRIVYADGSRAIVYDEYKNRSYAVDASRKTSPGPPPDSPELWRVAFELRRVEGYWKVTDSERYE